MPAASATVQYMIAMAALSVVRVSSCAMPGCQAIQVVDTFPCRSYPCCLPLLPVPPGQAEVSSEEAEAMARRLGLKFYRTCVKEDMNVTEGKRPGPQPTTLL
jgi:hypothetical protein